MAGVKKTRKQLLKEPDEFISFSAKLMKFAMAYRTRLTWAVIAIVAVAASVAGMQYAGARADRKSLAMLESQMRHYGEVLRESGPQAAQQKVQGEFERLFDQYPSGVGGKFGLIMYGDICYYAGQTEKAIGLYEKSLGMFQKDPSFLAIIYNDIAYAQEKAGNTDKAIESFEAVVSADTRVLKSDAAYHLGQLYSAAGNAEKSRQMYQKILDESPDFVYSELVKERVGISKAEIPNG